MRRIFFIVIILQVLFSQLSAQISGNFIVNGDFDKFYPVTFYDGGWDNNTATELSIGRSDVHGNSTWRGSVIAHFRYHGTNWGHESSFIDADVKQFNVHNTTSPNTFIAGWEDASPGSTSRAMVIWLRGGGTTYFYHSNYAVSPTVYDNNQNPLPYVASGYLSVTYKTTIDSYVNSKGISNSHTAFFNGDGVSYFKGQVGIGIINPQAKLAVNGDIMAKKIKVIQTGWPDYVFQNSYRLRPLCEVEQFIKERHHLPEVAPAEEVESNGLNVGDNLAVLLKKIEELTLYAIEQQKVIDKLEAKMKAMEGTNK
jgi:hypothetical protein